MRQSAMNSALIFNILEFNQGMRKRIFYFYFAFIFILFKEKFQLWF